MVSRRSTTILFAVDVGYRTPGHHRDTGGTGGTPAGHRCPVACKGGDRTITGSPLGTPVSRNVFGLRHDTDSNQPARFEAGHQWCPCRVPIIVGFRRPRRLALGAPVVSLRCPGSGGRRWLESVSFFEAQRRQRPWWCPELSFLHKQRKSIFRKALRHYTTSGHSVSHGVCGLRRMMRCSRSNLDVEHQDTGRSPGHHRVLGHRRESPRDGFPLVSRRCLAEVMLVLQRRQGTSVSR